MYCPECGTQLDDDAVFCSNCGTRVAEVEPEETPEAPVMTNGPRYSSQQPPAPKQRDTASKKTRRYEEPEPYYEEARENKKSPVKKVIVSLASVVIVLGGGFFALQQGIIDIPFLSTTGKTGQTVSVSNDTGSSGGKQVTADASVKTEKTTASEKKEATVKTEKKEASVKTEKKKETTTAQSKADVWKSKKDEDPIEAWDSMEDEASIDEWDPIDEWEEDVMDADDIYDFYDGVAQSLSTTKYANAMDGEWAIDYIFYGGKNQGRVITDPATSRKIFDDMQPLLNGGWKAYMFSADSDYYDRDWERYLSVWIATTDSDFQIRLDWKYVYNAAKEQTIEEDGKDIYKGTFDAANGSAKASGEYGSIEIDEFYVNEDFTAEYALGTYSWPSGEKYHIALMRTAES